MAMKVKLDYGGVGDMLNSPQVAAAVRALAEDVARNARAAGVLSVDVHSYTTDRAAASVTVSQRNGVALQARDGVLTRAAAAAGLEVFHP